MIYYQTVLNICQLMAQLGPPFSLWKTRSWMMTYFAESSMAQLLSTWPGSLKVPSWDKWEMVVIGVEAEKKGGCLGTTVLSKDPGPFPCTPPPRDTQTCLGDPWGAALPSPATSSILSPYVHTLGCILRAKPATMLRHACKLPSQGGFQGPLASAPTPCCSALLHHHHPLPEIGRAHV